MQVTLDVIQAFVNAGAGALFLTVILGKVIPTDKIAAVAFKAGAALSRWGIKALNVKTWNAIESHILSTLTTIHNSFGSGLLSDNEE